MQSDTWNWTIRFNRIGISKNVGKYTRALPSHCSPVDRRTIGMENLELSDERKMPTAYQRKRPQSGNSTKEALIAALETINTGQKSINQESSYYNITARTLRRRLIGNNVEKVGLGVYPYNSNAIPEYAYLVYEANNNELTVTVLARRQPEQEEVTVPTVVPGLTTPEREIPLEQIAGPSSRSSALYFHPADPVAGPSSRPDIFLSKNSDKISSKIAFILRNCSNC
ncbi:hypothetical protein HHI36_017418 [Cryptolaemus montrouzieri]|uniref:HTH psq-type domain-containing protein n=1 Tax=Cryptolaemus montrouzieri TaxID=559131 RepID=A0ABD2NNH9_9CUCU